MTPPLRRPNTLSRRSRPSAASGVCRLPRGARGRTGEDQSLSAFQFARSKNGGSLGRSRSRPVAGLTDDRFFLRDCNGIKSRLRFSSREPCAFFVMWRQNNLPLLRTCFFRGRLRGASPCLTCDRPHSLSRASSVGTNERQPGFSSPTKTHMPAPPLSLARSSSHSLNWWRRGGGGKMQLSLSLSLLFSLPSLSSSPQTHVIMHEPPPPRRRHLPPMLLSSSVAKLWLNFLPRHLFPLPPTLLSSIF